MRAGRDLLGREADDLVVFAHRLSAGDAARGDLVARRDGAGGDGLLPVQPGPGQQVDPGGDHVVGGVQADGEAVPELCPGSAMVFLPVGPCRHWADDLSADRARAEPRRVAPAPLARRFPELCPGSAKVSLPVGPCRHWADLSARSRAGANRAGPRSVEARSRPETKESVRSSRRGRFPRRGECHDPTLFRLRLAASTFPMAGCLTTAIGPASRLRRRHGPVVRELYQACVDAKNRRARSRSTTRARFDRTSKYGHLLGLDCQITHAGTPWHEVWNGRGQNSIIPNA